MRVLIGKAPLLFIVCAIFLANIREVRAECRFGFERSRNYLQLRDSKFQTAGNGVPAT